MAVKDLLAMAKALEGTKAIVVDLDKTTLGPKRGESFIHDFCIDKLSEARRKHDFAKLARGLKSAAKVELKLRPYKGRDTRDWAANELAYSALNNFEVTQGEFVEYARLYALERRIRAVEELLVCFGHKTRIIATVSGSTIAQETANRFQMNGAVSNVDAFERGKLAGIKGPIHDGKTKAENADRMLKTMGIDGGVKDAAVIDDGLSGLVAFKEAMVSIASPFALPEVSEAADFQLELNSRMTRLMMPFLYKPLQGLSRR